MLQNNHLDNPPDTREAAAIIYILVHDDESASYLLNTLQDEFENKDIHLVRQSSSLFENPSADVADCPVLFITDDEDVVEEIGEWISIEGIVYPCLLYTGGNAEATVRLLKDKGLFFTLSSLSVPDSTLPRVVKDILYPAIAANSSDLKKKVRLFEGTLDEVKQHLSVFYHSINNPLTVLSGNIQLLQILADSQALSSDMEKSIHDIGGISARFEADLKMITQLRESLNSVS